MDDRLAALLDEQAGVVSRRQATLAGLRPHELERMLRRKELVRLHPGVFVDHTGEPTWLQRAWGGVLLHDGSALGGASAMRAHEGPGSRRPEALIELVVDRDRNVADRPGLDVRRMRGLETRVLWNLGPPRLRYEEAALEVAARAATRMDVIGELSRAVQSRRTTAGRLLDVLATRERYPDRRWVEGMLRDVAAGTCSVLEHGYLTHVERPHGLTGARRQVVDRLGAGAVYRDVCYACGLIVELDGRFFHDTTSQRDHDMDRDLDAAAEGKHSARVGWGQVFDRPCWTASRVARLLVARGWTGTPRACGRDCFIR